MRRAHPEDASGVAGVHVASWRAAYGGLLPAPYLASLSVAERTRAWEEILGTPDAGGVVVADTAAGVVGFAQVGPCGDVDASPGTGEVLMLYLNPDRWGRGLGRDLLAAALDALAREGYRRASLWMLSSNDRARRFYLRQGWTPMEGERHQVFGGRVVTDHRFGRALAGTPVPGEPE